MLLDMAVDPSFSVLWGSAFCGFISLSVVEAVGESPGCSVWHCWEPSL